MGVPVKSRAHLKTKVFNFRGILELLNVYNVLRLFSSVKPR